MHRKFSVSILFTLITVGSLQPLNAQKLQSSGGVTSAQQLARDIFKELIEIRTTVKIGCTKASEAMMARLKGAGFSDQDMVLAGPTPINQNLVVRYRGKGTLRPILLIAHLDVVEARREDWSLDPFTFTEAGGYFYGRGTNDMKCEAAEIVANFIRMKKEGFVPNRDIILALTDDEEEGDADGVKWLIANRRPLIDAEYGINLEGGGGDIRKGKHAMMEVQTGEKVYISFQLEVKNPGGHSSLPVKENAIYRLAAGLVRLSQYDFPVHLNETTRLFFERSAMRETGRIKDDLLAILKTPVDQAAAERLSVGSPYYNAMMRTTIVATMLSGGHAENALPQSAKAVVNCRMLPDGNVKDVERVLAQVLADSQITITPMNVPFVSPVSPLRKDIMDEVEKLTAATWPGVIVTPVMSTGASDGKWLRIAGIPVYGVSGMFADIDDVRAHGKDERIGVKEFYEGFEFMHKFLEAITGGS